MAESMTYTRHEIADWLNTRGVVWMLMPGGEGIKLPHSTRQKNPDGTWADGDTTLTWREHEQRGYLAEGRDRYLKGEGDLAVCPGTLPAGKGNAGHVVVDIDKIAVDPVLEYFNANVSSKPVHIARKPGKEGERAHVWYQASCRPGSGEFFIEGVHGGELRAESDKGKLSYIKCYEGEIEGVMNAYVDGVSPKPITAGGFALIAKPGRAPRRQEGKSTQDINDFVERDVPADSAYQPSGDTKVEDVEAWLKGTTSDLSSGDWAKRISCIRALLGEAGREIAWRWSIDNAGDGAEFEDDLTREDFDSQWDRGFNGFLPPEGEARGVLVKASPDMTFDDLPLLPTDTRTDEPSYDDVINWALHGQMGLGFLKPDGESRYIPLPEKGDAPEGFVMPDPKTDKLIAPMSEWGLDCALVFIRIRIRQITRGGKRLQWKNGKRTEKRWKTLEDDGIDKMVELLARKVRQAKYAKGGGEYFVSWRISPEKVVSWGRARCFDHRRVDPFLTYARGCVEIEGGPTIEQWMNDVFGVERTPYNDWHSSYPWIRMAELALRPGMIRSLLPLWIMSTGRNKSTALGWMLPPEEHEWFAESIDMQAPNKERLESITGAVLGEVADMSPFMSRSMLAKAKAFITRRNDRGTRRAYARTEANEPRLVCLIATSDKHGDAIPNDPAGLRRFPPLVMPKVPSGTPPHMSNEEVEEYFGKWRGHFIAQAFRRVKAGERADLPSSLYGVAAKAAEDQRSKDHLVEDVVMNMDKSKAYRLGDLIEMVGFVQRDPAGFTVPAVRRVGRGDHNEKASYRIKDALATYGWSSEKASLNGPQARWWIHATAPRDVKGRPLVTPYVGDGVSAGVTEDGFRIVKRGAGAPSRAH